MTDDNAPSPDLLEAAKVDHALRALRALRVVCRGPFVTPKKSRVYLLDGCVVTESELVLFHQNGKFTAAAIAKFLSDLKLLQAAQSALSPFPTEASPQERRRSQRMMLRLDVLVRFQLPDSVERQTQAFTVAVNAHGGLMESPFRLTMGQSITLLNPQTGRDVRATVVKVHRSSEGYFTTAFEFADPNPQFWTLAFPPLDWSLTKKEA